MRINLEDGRPDGTLARVELHAAKIAAIKAAATAIRDGRPADLRAPSYAEVQALGRA
nr:hypothetical protein [Streptomyces sp. ME19-01-6]